MFDKNMTGRISLAELGEVLGSVGQLIASDVSLTHTSGNKDLACYSFLGNFLPPSHSKKIKNK